ncbi:hypothetical protein IWX50DRAFT_643982 [Phyllosticta citricarpa]
MGWIGFGQASERVGCIWEISIRVFAEWAGGLGIMTKGDSFLFLLLFSSPLLVITTFAFSSARRLCLSVYPSVLLSALSVWHSNGWTQSCSWFLLLSPFVSSYLSLWTMPWTHSYMRHGHGDDDNAWSLSRHGLHDENIYLAR